MEIEHRNNHFLTDTDYWSHLGANLCFDPLLKEYIKQVNAMRQHNPSPTALPPAPENMPYFWGPRLPAMPPPPAPDTYGNSSQEIPACVATSSLPGGAPIVGLQHLLNYPVCFGTSTQSVDECTSPVRFLYNSDVTLAAIIFAKFDWAVYSFNSGHFASTFKEHKLPFNVVLACNPFANKWALFKDVCTCPMILSSMPLLRLDHI
jgi:hypothetical protein